MTNHTNCTHEATKAARAKCRRDEARRNDPNVILANRSASQRAIIAARHARKGS